jgi:diadenosine tetraphosphate (Ap4A) HIT family hydrolase
MANFELHQKLEADSIFIARYLNLQVRLIKDSRFFWLLLIPERAGLTEWHMLNSEEQRQISYLTSILSKELKNIENADKINIGALGNIVEQFHFHIIARHQTDNAWPGPVWGAGTAERTDTRLFEQRCQQIADVMAKLD